MVQCFILLTICLYIVNASCQREQRITVAPGNHGNQLPDQEMSKSQETAVLVPLSQIDSILPFESFESFTYVPPDANTSIGLSTVEPTVTLNASIEPIHAAQITITSKIETGTVATNTVVSISSTAAYVSGTLLSSSLPVSSKSPVETISATMNVPMPVKNVVVNAVTSTAISTKVDNKAAHVPPVNKPPVPPNKAPSPPPPPNKPVNSVINSPTTVTATVTKSIKTTETITITAEDAAEKRMKSCYRKNKKVPFSQYWIPKENEWDENNQGKRVYLGGTEKKDLKDKNNKVIAKVPIDMYSKCEMEGTCLLENGDLINIDNTTKHFIKVGGLGREHNVFGLGSGPQNLVPYISVAANDIPYGEKLYISKLDGLDLGNGIKHNGCVRVDDDSWSFESCQIDFFVLSYVDYLWLDLEDEASIQFSDCELKNYITKQHLALVKASSNEKIIPSLMNDKYKF